MCGRRQRFRGPRSRLADGSCGLWLVRSHNSGQLSGNESCPCFSKPLSILAPCQVVPLKQATRARGRARDPHVHGLGDLLNLRVGAGLRRRLRRRQHQRHAAGQLLQVPRRVLLQMRTPGPFPCCGTAPGNAPTCTPRLATQRDWHVSVPSLTSACGRVSAQHTGGSVKPADSITATLTHMPRAAHPAAMP